MMYWRNGMGGGGMLLMTVSGLLLWGLIIAGIVMLVRSTARGERSPRLPRGACPLPAGGVLLAVGSWRRETGRGGGWQTGVDFDISGGGNRRRSSPRR